MTDPDNIGTTDGQAIPAALAARVGKRVRPGKHATVVPPSAAEPIAVPLAADIAAVTLIDAPAPEPVELPHPTAAAPADPVQEETIMATTADTVTQTADTTIATGARVFADMNDRAKGTMDRGAKLFEEMLDMNKANLEALVASGRIAARGMEAMTRDAAEQARRQFEGATAAVRTLAAVKSPTEFLRVQGELARAAIDGAVAQTSHSTEAMLKLAGEVAQPISNRVAVVADRIKTAA